jgi:murein L,D-transpeptidase YcbB/YkuD
MLIATYCGIYFYAKILNNSHENINQLINAPGKLHSEIENNILKLKLKRYIRNTNVSRYPIIDKHVNTLREFYAKNKYKPIWELNYVKINSFLSYIKKSVFYGLHQRFYYYNDIRVLFDNVTYSNNRILLEVLLSSVYLEFCKNIELGFVDIRKNTKIFADYTHIKNKDISTPLYQKDRLNYLRNCIFSNVRLTKFRNHFIKELNKRLENTRKISIKRVNNWINYRIKKENSLQIYSKRSLNFKKKKLKEHYGIENFEDKYLTAFLNLDNKGLYKKYISNFEMKKWSNYYPNLYSKTQIYLNIPEKKLKIKNRKDRYIERVCVGKINRNKNGLITQTPLLFSYIEDFTVNPNWYIPHSIFEKEILYNSKRDKHYLKKNNIKIFNKYGELNIKDYLTYNKEAPIYIKQSTENIQTLGKVKVTFYNKSNIYIHGTNAKSHFANARRDVTHGCIRILNEDDVINFILWNNISKKNKTKYDNIIDSEEWVESRIRLNNRIPIKIMYNTLTFENNKRKIHYDIYKYEKEIMKIYKNKTYVPRGTITL